MLIVEILQQPTEMRPTPFQLSSITIQEKKNPSFHLLQFKSSRKGRGGGHYRSVALLTVELTL